MKDPLDEQALVEKAKNSNPDAFGQLYDLYYSRIYGYAYFKTGNRYEAEDITEQVFLKALENIERFEWQGITLLPWLLRIASNAVADHFRTRKHAIASLEEEREPASDASYEPEMVVVNASERRAVIKALQMLTEEQQQVITMRFMADMKSEEVAKAMNKKPGAIRALQHRAIETLGRVLGESYDGAKCG
jgi:RNA polymerase sigma-70 factor (ECF subfamily)